MAGAGRRARSNAVDPQLLTELPDEVEALGRADLSYGTLCHRLTPFWIGCPLPRLASRRCPMLIGRIRPASPRTAAPAVSPPAPPRFTPCGVCPAGAGWASFDHGCRDVAPGALAQQVLYVEAREGPGTPAWA